MSATQNEKAAVAVPYVTHTPEQMKNDRDGWTKQIRLFKDEWSAVRDEPGDMKHRGIWTFEGTMSYVPYSQMSCGIGLANVYEVGHLDRLVEIAKHYGKVFLLTLVKQPLIDAAQKNPNYFLMAKQQSWMGHGRDIYIYGVRG